MRRRAEQLTGWFLLFVGALIGVECLIWLPGWVLAIAGLLMWKIVRICRLAKVQNTSTVQPLNPSTDQ